MYVCMYVCTYVYVCMYVCMYAHMYVHGLFKRIYIYIYMCVCVQVQDRERLATCVSDALQQYQYKNVILATQPNPLVMKVFEHINAYIP